MRIEKINGSIFHHSPLSILAFDTSKIMESLILILWLVTCSQVGQSQSHEGKCDTIQGSLLKCEGIRERSRFVDILLPLNRDPKITNISILNSSEDVVGSFLEKVDKFRLHELKEVSIMNAGLQQVPSQILGILGWSSNLQLLNLSQNHISQVPDKVLKSSRNLTVDFSWNKISHIGEHMNESVKLVLYENPNLDCDWLQSHFLQVANDSDFKRLRCKSSNGIFNQMTMQQVSSVLRSDVCNSCSCFANNLALTVNCTSRGLSTIPQVLPYDTKVVILESNQITELQFNETSNWNNVLYLFLNNNTIENLAGFISDQGSEILKNLVLLHLESNRLRSINGSFLNPRIEKLYLKNNPWRCDCNLVDFRSWLEKHVDRVSEIDQIKCASSPSIGERNGIHFLPTNEDPGSENEGSIIINLRPDQLCPDLKEFVYQEDPVKNAILDSVSISLFLLTSIILAKVFYDSRWQKRTGKLPKFFRLNK